MCNLKTWYKSEDGYIQQCAECNCFQVIFGTTMFAMDESRFRSFADLVLFRCNSLVSVDEDLRYIVLPTAGPATRMLLNERELRALNDMLQYVDTELTTAGLLELFEGR